MHNHHDNEGFTLHIIDVFNHSIMITFFVVVMMMIIEVINIQTKGKSKQTLKKNGFLQIIVAGLMGMTPGCLGTFAMVSLYINRTISFAALVTVMIATSGDEIFVMLAMLPPKTSFLLVSVLLVIAILSGVIVHFLSIGKNTEVRMQCEGIVYHKEEDSRLFFPLNEIRVNYKSISFERALLLFGFIIFIISLASGTVGGDDWNWERITFLITSIIGLLMIVTISEHFLSEHLWNHIIRKHFIKIFLWTFSAFVLINLLNQYIDVEAWIKSNSYVILIIAVLIGLIPESGPHIVFISLFSVGSIPFSILLANSIVQDGHGAVPLLAESRKSFFLMKLVNALVGLFVGAVLLLFGV